MKRLLAATALILGACPEPPAPPRAEAPYVYEPDLAPWPPAPVTGAIGRGPRLAAPAPTGLRAGPGVSALAPIDVQSIFTVPGDGPARAIASGAIGNAAAVELVDVDAGVVRWRDLAQCDAPVVHVSDRAVVCADAVHAVGLALDDGRVLWRRPLRVSGGTGGLAVATDGAMIVIVDAGTGAELARSQVPDLGGDEPRAACRDGDGFDVYTAGRDGAVRRIAFGPNGGGARVVWTAMIGSVIDLDATNARANDACDELVSISAVTGADDEAVVALTRATGAIAGGPIAARGDWRARDGSDAIELATDRGLERRTRALADPIAIDDLVAAGLVASRGDRRLVRTRTGALVMLDRGGARTILPAPLGVGRAVLGDRFVVSGPWHGVRTDADALRRYPLPAPSGDEPARDPILVDDPTRYDHPDLPAPTPVDEAAAIARAGAGAYHVGAVIVDPAAPHIIYAVPMEQRPSDQAGAGLAAFDLRARAWTWHRADGCPPGTPLALAVAPDADAIICAARAYAGVSGVRATSRKDGHALWTWSGPVNTIVAGAHAVAILSASHVTLVDAATGAELDRFGADDGWMPRVAIAEVGVQRTDFGSVTRGGGLLISAERGAIVARSIRTMLPRWAVRVRGSVASIALAGDRIAVALGDGELFFVDPATGLARPAAAWSPSWQVPGGADLALIAARDPVLREWRVAGFTTDGALRFRTALAPESEARVGERGRAAGAPLAIAYGPGLREVAVVEPVRGALRGLFMLPDRAVPGVVFSTVVDGKPVTGAVLSHPLAVVTF